MSSFTTPLDTRELGDGRFEILADFVYYLADPHGEQVIVPKGYITDFATTKWFSFIFPPYSPDYGKACVVHDYLCTDKRILYHGWSRLCTRKEADMIFLQAMGVLHCPLIKKSLMYTGVRLWAALRGL